MSADALQYCCPGEAARAATPGAASIGFRYVEHDHPDAPSTPPAVVATKAPDFGTFIHEASHVVVAASFGWRVRWVSRVATSVEYPVGASWLHRAAVNLAGVIGEHWLPPKRTFRPAPLDLLERVGGHCANGVGGGCDHCRAFVHSATHADTTGTNVIVEWREAERLAFAIVEDRWSSIYHLAREIEKLGRIEGENLAELLK